MTAVSAATRAPTRRRGGLAFEMFKTMFVVTASAWLILVSVISLVAAGIAIFGRVESSIWIGALWGPQYYMLVLGIILTSTFLRVYVAHGRTRREFIVGAFGYGLLKAGLLAVLMIGAFAVERALLSASGVEQFASGDADMLAGPGAATVTTVKFFVLYLTYFLAGWLIATGYYLFGFWTGTAVLLPAILPLGLTETMFWGTGPAVWMIDALVDDPLALRMLSVSVPLACVLLMSAAVTAMLWSAPVTAAPR